MPKLSHPIVGCVAFWFFNLGCFPVAVAVGQVALFLVINMEQCCHGGMRMGSMLEFPIFWGMLRVVAFGLFYIQLSFLKQSKRKL